MAFCLACNGNVDGGNAMPFGSDTGTQGGNTGSTGGSSGPVASDGNMSGGTNGNGMSGNGNTANGNATGAPGTKGGTCASMPGPCSTTVEAIPLTGCSSGDYRAQVTLGGKQFSMLVDTGSTTVAVVDADCTDCQGVTPVYTPSTGAQNTGTKVQSSYGTGNGWSGTTVTDTVQLTASVKALSMRFARITNQTSTSSGLSFFSGSDCTGGETQNAHQGIFGMGNASGAVAGTDSYLDMLKAAGQVQDAFAFEACDSSGSLWLGGYDPSSVTAAPVFTPLDISKGYDLVTLNGVTIGDTKTSLASADFGQTLVDTGTSIFLLPTQAFDSLTAVIEADAKYSSVMPRGFLASSEFVPAKASRAELDAQLPPMHLTFPGMNRGPDITIDLPASESYLTPFTYNGQAGYLSGIAPVDASPTTTILGNSTMHTHVLIFDRAGGQLGYAPHAACP